LFTKDRVYILGQGLSNWVDSPPPYMSGTCESARRFRKGRAINSRDSRDPPSVSIDPKFSRKVAVTGPLSARVNSTVELSTARNYWGCIARSALLCISEKITSWKSHCAKWNVSRAI